MNRAFRITAAAAALASLLVACQLLVGVKDEEENLRPVSSADGGADDAGTADSSAGDPCKHAGPLPAPRGGPSLPSDTHYFAVRAVRIGGFEEYPRAYDFDGICSCENRDTRPGAPQSACIPARPPCDSPRNDDSEGRDIAGVNAFPRNLIGEALDTIEKNDVNSKFEEGLLGFVIGVEGYNGSVDDPQVRISFVVSNGIQATGGAVRPEGEACSARNDAGVLPKWDGGVDRWYVPRGGIESRAAYVTNGVLVSNNLGSSYALPIGGLTIRQSDPIFHAAIGKSDGGAGLMLRGNLVGLVSADNILGVIGAFRANAGGTRICDEALTFGTFKTFVCPARDLLLAGKDPTVPCDAFSLAVGIEAFEIAMGDPISCPDLPQALCDAKCEPVPR